ncbi:hypothetical protein A2678_03320 [Candidatus Kaiserbacteria bacterium RIFCSPHIGHO2_01_FULL_53_31]|uniref:Uncharacterized protein n=1 Tax=Candidatus Kaiserbacteria bacterium RIFCSPHIGHO2_01_FULL_53_31 TaxID=1798481 RepID=A0A1F6CGZ8_9BACT|nr:MAG: hypothetical protein A2678_03320 [Candidatus Kaiserbacteria bacterium RIFCSPHIGHO2_01_FULL_53_31]
MTDDSGGESIDEVVPKLPGMPHYHGDEVRGLFVLGALTIIFAESTGAEHLPLSTFTAVLSAALLVIAAGITNPKQLWIHWVNAFFAAMGTLLFGTSAVTSYRAGISIFDPSFVYVEALALISLLALYFTTRTIRGILLRPTLI